MNLVRWEPFREMLFKNMVVQFVGQLCLILRNTFEYISLLPRITLSIMIVVLPSFWRKDPYMEMRTK